MKTTYDVYVRVPGREWKLYSGGLTDFENVTELAHGLELASPEVEVRIEEQVPKGRVRKGRRG
jgi:hypothetical protein